MEENPNGGKQKNPQQDLKDTVDVVKDGANLAKNAASGNYLGAVKDALKLLGNKKTWKIILISILLPIIIVVSLEGSLLSIFDKVGDVIQSVVDAIVSIFTIKKDWDGRIVIDNEEIDKIIDEMATLGFDMEDLYLMGDIDYSTIDKESEEYKEAMRKYIRKFYEAQAVTETPYANLVEVDGETYGRVYIYRNDGNGAEDDKGTLLKYMEYEEMCKLANDGNLEAIRYRFSLDEDGKLVIPSWSESWKDLSGAISDKTFTVKLEQIDYKNLISQYTTPMNFFIYLAMTVQNPEFVSAVTELVKDSEIDITLFNNENKQTITATLDCVKHTIINGQETTEDSTVTEKIIESEVKTIPQITYVKTWFCEQTMKYTADATSTAQKPTVKRLDDDSQMEGIQSWLTEKILTIDKETTIVTYNESYRSEVIDKTGEKGDQGVANVDSERQVPEDYIIDENTTFLGLMDDYFRIPNTTVHYEAVSKTNLVTAAEWLFGLLQKDAELQMLEQVMRYIMYKYTGTDYGVTSLDFSIFNIEDFSSISETGSFSAFGTNLSREEFIVAVQAYNGGSSYSKLSSDAGDFYDICTSEEYNVNPCLAFAWTCIETKYGATYNNYEQSVKDFCKLVVEPVTEGTSGYSKTTNLTSLQEKTGNLKYSVETRTKVAKAIFGNDCFLRTNKTIVDAAINIVADHFINSGVTVHYANDSVERIYKKSGKNGRTVIYNNIQKSWDLPIKYPDKYGLVCATFVSMAIWKAGLIDEATINSYGYNACKGVVSMLTKSNQWQEITNWEDLQEGDIVYQTNHIYIYMDGGKCLDQAYCVKRSTGKDDRGKLSTAEKSKFLKAYRYIEN